MRNGKENKKVETVRYVLSCNDAYGTWSDRGEGSRCKENPTTCESCRRKRRQDQNLGDGMTIKEEELLTDGDKYYLKHNDTDNKDGKNWEAYQERGTEVTSTNAKDKGVWVQTNLGASYPD